MRRSTGLIAATASFRFATVVLQSVLPTYAILKGLGAEEVSLIVVALWVGIGAGSLAASLVRRSDLAIALGLPLMSLGLAMMVIRLSAAVAASLLSGIGAGLLGPTLAPSMHVLSDPMRPHEGAASYSLALSAGLISATLLAAVARSANDLALLLVIAIVAPMVATFLVLVERPTRLEVSIPKPQDLLLVASNRRFLRAFAINTFLSLALPLVLSYWPSYAVKVLGVNVSEAFLLLATLFIVSALMRSLLLRASPSKLNMYYVAAIASFLVASVLLAAGGWSLLAMLAIVGLIAMSLPHAFVYPLSLYDALSSAPGMEVKAGYMFSISSGAGEVLGPIIAALIINAWGLRSVYAIMPLFSVMALVSYLALSSPGRLDSSATARLTARAKSPMNTGVPRNVIDVVFI